MSDDLTNRIAITGMAGRFPGARSVEELWANLCGGVESVSFFPEAELAAAGVPEELLRHPRYVRARAVLDDVASFDAGLFGFSPREARVMDPQIRLFLETAWEALESGGCDPDRFRGHIGVFAGVSWNTYLLHNLAGHRQLLASVGPLLLRILNDKDFLTTWVSYRLNLRGPSIAVQTACSTSLVATHLACQSLLNFECDAALAGGVTVALPQREGYLHEEGSIYSPDGHCRPFDASARGTVGGSGAGLVLLRRLSDAIADGDPVRAVIRGSAINNDGSLKMGYMAPSVDAQAEVIAAAQSIADVEPDAIGYIEAHGTGTLIGDPIEVEALTRVFSERSSRRGFCALGSVKSNLGHLDQASGITGLIKTALAVERGLLPPTLHYERPNPEIDFDNGPFYVSTSLSAWQPEEGPRRAGVSSFGVGGTNAHVIVEEPPPASPSGPSRVHQLLLLSARTRKSLDGNTARLAEALASPSAPALADAAYTLQTGRRQLAQRRMLVCRDARDAAAALTGPDPERVRDGQAAEGGRKVAFLFPGQGAQHPGMARELYGAEPTFRRHADEACEILGPALGAALRELAFGEARGEDAAARLAETSLAQPALFVVEHALARLWMEWGVRPEAMIGHSVGEYVGACLAGVFDLEEALALVAARGRIVQAVGRGAMLSVRLSEAELLPRLGSRLSLAAVNAPGACVVSGPEEAVAALELHLAGTDVEHRRLPVSHAFHSALMEPAVAELRNEVRRFRLRPPQIPFLSNVSGTWITPEEATDPAYWARHLRQTVRFSDGIAALLERFDGILLEVGPGRSLGTLAREHRTPGGEAPAVLASLRHPRDVEAVDGERLLDALGRLWLAGVPVDWDGFYAHESRRKQVLPTYAFDRQRSWIDPVPDSKELSGSLAAEPMDETGLDEETTAVAPPAGDEVEQAIAAIWQELLGVPRVGLHEDFFELGGHSLLATRVVTRLRESLNCDLPLDALFQSATVARLSERVRDQLSAPPADLAAPPTPAAPLTPTAGGGEGERVLSFGQQRLWLLHQLEPGSAAYNMPFAVRLRGPLDIEALDRALAEIFRRHEVLRTTFPSTPDGRPTLAVAPPGPFAATVTDLRHLPLTGRSDEVEKIFGEEPREPFDLASGPLVRVRLLRLAEEESLVLLTFHHIVFDAWSEGVFIRELTGLYPAMAAGEPSPLPELPLQYAGYAQWQRERLAGGRLEEELAYWQENLNAEPGRLGLPADAVSDTSGSRDTAGSCPLAVTADLCQSLAALGRREGATLFMTLLSAYDVLLHVLTGREDLQVGTSVAGRTRTELEPLVGFFANTLVLRSRLEGNPTFVELLRRNREATRGAYVHQEIPYDQVVTALRNRRGHESDPLCHAWFVLQNAPRALLTVQGLEITPLWIESASARHDLFLNLWEEGEGLAGYLEYRTALVKPSTAAHWGELLVGVLSAVAAEPELHLAELVRRLRRSDREKRLPTQHDVKRASLDTLKKIRRKNA